MVAAGGRLTQCRTAGCHAHVRDIPDQSDQLPATQLVLYTAGLPIPRIRENVYMKKCTVQLPPVVHHANRSVPADCNLVGDLGYHLNHI